MQSDPIQTDLDLHEIAPDWRNAVQMIRAAGYVHPAEVIESFAAEIERLRAALQNRDGDVDGAFRDGFREGQRHANR